MLHRPLARQETAVTLHDRPSFNRAKAAGAAFGMAALTIVGTAQASKVLQ